MDFEHSDKVKDLIAQVTDFMDRYVYDAEKTAHQQVAASGNKHHHPEIIEELKPKARDLGLWNLFLPDPEHGGGLNNLEYAPLAEIMGRSLIASEIFNCSAPDTGNMEILAEFGTPEQKQEWLQPLLDGKIRSTFSMTEPGTPGSDPTQLKTLAVRDGDDYVINGRKWFSSNAYHPHCKILIAMVVTDPEAERHRRASQILVPLDTPGVNLIRPVMVFGDDGGHAHAEIVYDNCRVPAKNLLGEQGDGFMISQARLGPGRIHHCMRAIGGAERAFDLMCQRAQSRVTHGTALADKGIIQHWIAHSRMEIDQARWMVLYTAWKMDKYSKKEARQEISMVKTIAANMFQTVVDRAMQTYGAMGFTDDVPLFKMWAYARTLRMADGPDEVHNMVVARREMRKYGHEMNAAIPHIEVPRS